MERVDRERSKIGRRVRIGALLAAATAGGYAFGCRPPEGPVAREVERRQIPHADVAHDGHVSDPALALIGDVPIVAYLRGMTGRFHVFVQRADGGDPVRVDPDALVPAPAHQPPGLAVGPDGALHVSWGARRPQPAGDHAAQPAGGHAAQPAGGHAVSDLRLSRSVDGGRHFETPVRVHGDEPISREFEGLAVASDGAAIVAWIDGRDGPASYAARVLDGHRVESEVRLDGDTCPCCRISVTAGPAGALAIAIRKIFPGQVRDFVLTRSDDAGHSFAPPVRVHEDGWAIEACPHRGGALALDDNGGAAFAWYTEGADQRAQLRFARAEAGAAFGAPIPLHEDPKTAPDRVALALAPDGRGIVVWEAFTPARRAILARATADGGRHFGPVQTLSHAVKAMGPAAAVASDGSLWVAWNEERYPALDTVLLRLQVDDAAQRTGTSK